MARFTYIPNRVIDTNGISDGATIEFFTPGTTTPVTMYSDAALTTPVSNPYTVAAGSAVPALYHNENGGIRVRVKDSSGATVSDDDPYGIDSDVINLDAGGTVSDAVKWVTPEMFGAAGDGTTDDSTAMQAAIDYLEANGGGKLLLQSSYLCGGLTVQAEDIAIEGNSRANKIIVKNGTTGFTVNQSWVHFRKMGLFSEGTEGDGLGTNGILMTKGTGSIGHTFCYDMDIEDFSGVGFELRNALDTTITSVFFRNCATGLKFGRNGTGGSDFSTTIQLINVYATSCANYGIECTYVYRSKFNVIAEFNGVGIYNNIGDITLDRCYFENNVTLGAQLIDTLGEDRSNYSNNTTTDAVSRTRSVIANSDWWTSDLNRDGDFHNKRLGLQTEWGRDTKYIAGVGTTDNIGLSYNTAIVPRIYGDDLIDQTAWTSKTTSEFVGWSPENNGFSITTSLTSIRGMKQNVTLDDTKTYVIDFAARNVSGNAISTVRVDSVTLTPGVPFQVGSTGSKVVECYANQSVASENYVEVFRLYEVLEDQSLIAQTADILSRKPTQRAQIYDSAAPSTGKWAVGEIVLNNAPVAGGAIGWICTTAGSPGTWSAFGLIATGQTYTPTNVTTDRAFDADTVAVAELADVVGTLIADLQGTGIID